MVDPAMTQSPHMARRIGSSVARETTSSSAESWSAVKKMGLVHRLTTELHRL
jgi:hypothetical protein